jgi:hypothetical protein
MSIPKPVSLLVDDELGIAELVPDVALECSSERGKDAAKAGAPGFQALP